MNQYVAAHNESDQIMTINDQRRRDELRTARAFIYWLGGMILLWSCVIAFVSLL